MIPDTIPFTSIDMGERGRTDYKGIEQLAQSIHDHGLIQPIVLSPIIRNHITECWDGREQFVIVAGGRRFTALRSLNLTSLHHAVTCDPLRPGFIIKGETSPFSNMLAEIAENLNRHNLDWRDEVRLMVKAWKLAKIENNSRGEEIIMADFGMSIGTNYARLQIANYIVQDLNANPKEYENITSAKGAQTYLMRKTADHLMKLANERSFVRPLTLHDLKVEVTTEPSRESDPEIDCEPVQVVDISSSFLNCNGIAFMSSCPAACFDHIVTDPDYAIDLEVLNSKGGAGYDVGVVQASVEDSLRDMCALIHNAFRTLKPQGFFVFFYDLDHHEKLQTIARDAGFAVQRWPLIWHKTDYQSNASPSTNFCKNVEYAMVCRKPGSVLAKVQMSSVATILTGDVTKRLGHPFAKPFELWKFIYQAISIKGQTVFDPCVGRGSSVLAALQFGLKPLGCEIQPEHYEGLIYNLQAEYKRLLGPNLQFI